MKITLLTKKFIAEFERTYIAYTNPPAPTGNAKVIAKWPAKRKSSLTGIGRLHKGPSQTYRVW